MPHSEAIEPIKASHQLQIIESLKNGVKREKLHKHQAFSIHMLTKNLVFIVLPDKILCNC